MRNLAGNMPIRYEYCIDRKSMSIIDMKCRKEVIMFEKNIKYYYNNALYYCFT